jgi:hypothetical protein
MSLEIHVLMQDSNNLDPAGHDTKEQDVAANGMLSVASAQLIASSTPPRITGDGLNAAMKQSDVVIGLSDSPTPRAVFPDSSEVLTSMR